MPRPSLYQNLSPNKHSYISPPRNDALPSCAARQTKRPSACHKQATSRLAQRATTNRVARPEYGGHTALPRIGNRGWHGRPSAISPPAPPRTEAGRRSVFFPLAAQRIPRFWAPRPIPLPFQSPEPGVKEPTKNHAAQTRGARPLARPCKPPCAPCWEPLHPDLSPAPALLLLVYLVYVTCAKSVMMM